MSHLEPSLFAFLSELAENNYPAWLEVNRERYEREVLHPTFALIAALKEPVTQLSPLALVVANAQGGNLLRAHRSVGTNRDKRPFHTHVSLQFPHVFARDEVHGVGPRLFLRLDPKGSAIAVGIWRPPTRVLVGIRNAIITQAETWNAATGPLIERGWAWEDDPLLHAPRGVDASHPLAAHLKRRSYSITLPLADEDLYADDAVERIVGRWKEADALMRFLCEAVGLTW